MQTSATATAPSLRFSSLLALVLLVAAAAGLAQVQSPVGAAVPGRYLVAYTAGLSPERQTTQVLNAGGRVLARHGRLGVAVIAATAEAAARLAMLPGITAVAQDRTVAAEAVQTSSPAPDSLYNSAQGWAVRQVGGTATTALGPGPWTVTQGAGVRIAILDSGVDRTHPDLAPNLLLNLSEIDQATLPSACDDGSPQDQQGHGSWTASLAAGALGPTTGAVAGVAPQAGILNIKVLERLPAPPTTADPTGCVNGQAGGLLSWVLQGMEDAVANRANVISLSLGTLVNVTTGDGAGLQTIFNQATEAAAQAGVILIAAAGNDGLSLDAGEYVELPAQSRGVLAIVAATNPDCAENLAAGATCAAGPVTRPYYSNYGASLNALAAPGGSYPAGPESDPTQPTGWIVGACSSGLPSTLSGPPGVQGQSFGCFGLGHTPYVQAIGTSAAAPLAAGVAALIEAANPTWNAAQVVAAMRSTATVLPSMSVPQVSALAAVNSAASHTQHIIVTVP